MQIQKKTEKTASKILLFGLLALIIGSMILASTNNVVADGGGDPTVDVQTNLISANPDKIKLDLFITSQFEIENVSIWFRSTDINGKWYDEDDFTLVWLDSDIDASTYSYNRLVNIFAMSSSEIGVNAKIIIAHSNGKDEFSIPSIDITDTVQSSNSISLITVHGIDGNPSDMDAFHITPYYPDYYDNYIAVDMHTNWEGDNRDQSHHAQVYVDDMYHWLENEYNTGNLKKNADIIAYSLGGVVARGMIETMYKSAHDISSYWWEWTEGHCNDPDHLYTNAYPPMVSWHNGEFRIRHFVSLGSPFHGHEFPLGLTPSNLIYQGKGWHNTHDGSGNPIRTNWEKGYHHDWNNNLADWTDKNSNGQYDDDWAESYTDLNDNGRWDQAEWYDDYYYPTYDSRYDNDQWDSGEPYDDRNRNGQYDYEEPYVDSYNNDKYDKGEYDENEYSGETLLLTNGMDYHVVKDPTFSITSIITNDVEGWNECPYGQFYSGDPSDEYRHTDNLDLIEYNTISCYRDIFGDGLVPDYSSRLNGANNYEVGGVSNPIWHPNINLNTDVINKAYQIVTRDHGYDPTVIVTSAIYDEDASASAEINIDIESLDELYSVEIWATNNQDSNTYHAYYDSGFDVNNHFSFRLDDCYLGGSIPYNSLDLYFDIQVNTLTDIQHANGLTGEEYFFTPIIDDDDNAPLPYDYGTGDLGSIYSGDLGIEGDKSVKDAGFVQFKATDVSGFDGVDTINYALDYIIPIPNTLETVEHRFWDNDQDRNPPNFPPHSEDASKSIDQMYLDLSYDVELYEDQIKPEVSFRYIRYNMEAEPFTDSVYPDPNANGMYDYGELFDDINNNGFWDGGSNAESYTDSNTNGEYDYGEPYSDRNHNGQYDGVGHEEVISVGYDGTPITTPSFVEVTVVEDTLFSEIKYRQSFLGEPFTDEDPFNGVWDEGEEYIDENNNGQYNPPTLGTEVIVDETYLKRGYIDQSEEPLLYNSVNQDGSYLAVFDIPVPNNPIGQYKYEVEVKDHYYDWGSYPDDNIAYFDDNSFTVDMLDDDVNAPRIEVYPVEYGSSYKNYNYYAISDGDSNTLWLIADDMVQGDDVTPIPNLAVDPNVNQFHPNGWQNYGTWMLEESYNTLSGFKNQFNPILYGEGFWKEPYEDYDNNGHWDMGEPYVDLDGSGNYTDNDVNANGHMEESEWIWTTIYNPIDEYQYYWMAIDNDDDRWEDLGSGLENIDDLTSTLSTAIRMYDDDMIAPTIYSAYEDTIGEINTRSNHIVGDLPITVATDEWVSSITLTYNGIGTYTETLEPTIYEQDFFTFYIPEAYIDYSIIGEQKFTITAVDRDSDRWFDVNEEYDAEGIGVSFTEGEDQHFYDLNYNGIKDDGEEWVDRLETTSEFVFVLTDERINYIQPDIAEFIFDLQYDYVDSHGLAVIEEFAWLNYDLQSRGTRSVSDTVEIETLQNVPFQIWSIEQFYDEFDELQYRNINHRDFNFAYNNYLAQLSVIHELNELSNDPYYYDLSGIIADVEAQDYDSASTSLATFKVGKDTYVTEKCDAMIYWLDLLHINQPSVPYMIPPLPTDFSCEATIDRDLTWVVGDDNNDGDTWQLMVSYEGSEFSAVDSGTWSHNVPITISLGEGIVPAGEYRLQLWAFDSQSNLVIDEVIMTIYEDLTPPTIEYIPPFPTEVPIGIDRMGLIRFSDYGSGLGYLELELYLDSTLIDTTRVILSEGGYLETYIMQWTTEMIPNSLGSSITGEIIIGDTLYVSDNFIITAINQLLIDPIKYDLIEDIYEMEFYIPELSVVETMVENEEYSNALTELETIKAGLTDTYQIGRVDEMIDETATLIALVNTIDFINIADYTNAYNELYSVINLMSSAYTNYAQTISNKINELETFINEGTLADNHATHSATSSITSIRSEDIDAPDITFNPSLPNLLMIGESWDTMMTLTDPDSLSGYYGTGIAYYEIIFESSLITSNTDYYPYIENPIIIDLDSIITIPDSIGTYTMQIFVADEFYLTEDLIENLFVRYLDEFGDIDEEYTDLNDNGIWDAGEPLEDLDGNEIWDANLIQKAIDQWGLGDYTTPFTIAGNLLPILMGEELDQETMLMGDIYLKIARFGSTDPIDLDIINNAHSTTFSHIFERMEDNIAPTVDSPLDITYEWGSINNEIVWTAQDNYGLDSFSINGIPSGILSGTSDQATINIDGLDLGDHSFEITIYDLVGNSITDNVLVSVEDTANPTISDHPDISYYEGEMGNTLHWDVSDNYILQSGSYSITRDAIEIASGSFDSNGDIISINVDGLAIGTYIYEITISDFSGNIASDTVQVEIMEVILPTIHLEHINTDGTDGMAGEITIIIDTYGTYPITSIDPNEQVLATLDIQHFEMSIEDSMGNIISATLDITLIDDDIDAPEITYEYTGNNLDNNAGQVIFTISDASGYTIVSGADINDVDNTLIGIEQTFTIEVIDNDNDRTGDALTSSLSISITIEDDDSIAPTLTVEHIGNSFDGDYGFIRVIADDASGLEYDPSGDYYGLIDPEIINTPQIITFSVTDTDADRPDDALTTEVSIEVTLTDDDIEAPIITIEYFGDGTDGDAGYIIVTATDSSGLSIDPSAMIYLDPTIIDTPQEFTFTATDADNDRAGDSLTTIESWSITLSDDDTEAPIIDIQYFGDYTDGNAGYIEVTATDNMGLALDPSGMYYLDPSIIGIPQEWIFTATDNDADRPDDALTTVMAYSITLEDDDMIAPEITINYYGDMTDGNAGYIEVSAYDLSGLSVDPSGIYTVDNTQIGTLQEWYFTAIDNDNDRADDSLTTTEYFSLTITDDDPDAPIITYEYTGNYFDENAGQVIFSVSDASGYTITSGQLINDLDNTKIGIVQTFNIEVIDNDNDRLGDELSSSLSVSITIEDDDTEAPIITIEYFGGYTDGEAGYLLVTASDNVGLAIDPSGTYYLDPSIINVVQEFSFTAIDNDEDRLGDSLSTTEIYSITLTDDDTEAPTIDIYYYGGYTDADAGYIQVIASDNMGLSVDPSGIYYIDNTLIGTLQEWTFEAIDNDEDRAGDSLSTIDTFSITILDDDTEAPMITTDLYITVDGTIMCSFNATDESGIDLENLIAFVDGVEQTILGSLQDEDTIYFDFDNTFSAGIHDIEVVISDLDNDRAGDSLSASIYGTFEIISTEDPIDAIDNLIDYVNENVDCRLARRIITHKLKKAKWFLQRDKLVQADIFLCLAEFSTILFEWFDIIDESTADYIITEIEYIRTLF